MAKPSLELSTFVTQNNTTLHHNQATLASQLWCLSNLNFLKNLSPLLAFQEKLAKTSSTQEASFNGTHVYNVESVISWHGSFSI